MNIKYIKKELVKCMNKSEISVIVPVYNVPINLLKKCLDSLKEQKIENVEYIIVDDGSNNTTANFCDKYLNDKRFKIFHKKNGGLSDARNYGFSKVTANWFMFLDGDDFLEDNTLNELANVVNNNEGYEVISFGCTRVLPKRKFRFNHGNQFKDNKIYTSNEMLKNILNFKCQMEDVTSKLFKTDFIKEHKILHSEEVKQGIEGLLYCFDVFKNGARLKYINKYFYNYVYNKESITNNDKISTQKYIFIGFEKIRKDIIQKNMNQEILKMYYNRLLYIVVSAAIRVYFSPNNKEKYTIKKNEFNKFLKQDIISDALEKADSSTLDYQRKIIIFLIKNRIFFPFLILGKLRKIQKEN